MDVHGDFPDHRASWFPALLLSSQQTRPSGSRWGNAVVISPLPLLTCLARGILLLARLADACLASGILLLALAAARIVSLLLHVTRHVSTVF